MKRTEDFIKEVERLSGDKLTDRQKIAIGQEIFHLIHEIGDMYRQDLSQVHKKVMNKIISKK